LDKAKFYALLKQGQGKLQAMGSRTVDLQEYLKSFKPLAVVGAGLVDGINPCAFTVIVFFVSFLALQGYRKRELFAIGLTFILAVFITYLLIGLGLFNFLYRIRSFWAVAKAVNIGIGLLSILLGFLAVADFIKYRKSKDTENMFLQLPKVIKERIHSVIGGHYRRLKTGGGSPAKTLLGLMLSALITGFLVSLLEAVCTGQLYLPTIAFVIKSGSLSARAVFYLLLYNLMFILPLAAIFLFALFGATSNEFSKFLKKHLGSIKILMSLMFFGLGILLLWRG
jgi:cytochrome c biogenesis protein CcdA